MKIKSSYLEAIQSIAGITPGEKHKTIHTIARQLARIESAENYLEDSNNPVPDVPESLKPLIRVEVAKILHRHEGIIDALKSDDPVVVARAVQADWFFDGTNTALVNAQYFRENVFPKISMFARLRVIKSFSKHLNNTSLAAEFFIAVAELYCVDQALPLLAVCDEEFAFNAIIERKIVLSLRQVEILYRKYPNLVMKYLKYENPDGDNVRNAYSVNILNYMKFLPEISVEHFEEFMEIYLLTGDTSSIKFSKNIASMFLKTRQDLLIEKPSKYLKLLPLEKVTRKMSRENFLKIFKALYPERMTDFCYQNLNDVLKYYGPAEDRLPLILKTFREVYGTDLLDNPDLVNYKIMQILPAAERGKMARLKLENDKDWRIHDPKKSWRCYLPTSESIPLITKEIAKSSDENTRRQLLNFLVFTCKINNDKNGLLKVLNYLYDRHRNEANNVFFGYIRKISDSFDLETLSSAHWAVINKCIKLAKIQGDLIDRPEVMIHVIEAAIYYCLLNNFPLDDYLEMYIDIIIKNCFLSSKFNKYPRFEKKLLELVMEQIPKQYPFDNIKFWKDNESEIIDSLTSSLWDYNERNKFLHSNPNRLSIKNYPWIFEKVRNCIFTEDDEWPFSRNSLLSSIKKNERDLYDAWLPKLPKFWTFGTNVIYDILRKRPQLIFDNWKNCLEENTDHSYRNQIFLRFVKKSRWYQYLPIRIFNASLTTYKNSEKTTFSMFLLGSLSDGESYTKIIEPFIPADEKLDLDDPKAKENLEILRAITRVIPKVNPPVSLDTIAKFCVGDYLQISIGSMFSVSSRVPVSDVMPFINTLMERRVSVQKHGIRLIDLLAPVEEAHAVLANLWKTEKHTSIRTVVFKKIYNLFREHPNDRNWRLFQTCLDSLDVDDDEQIFNGLSELQTVPNEYICDYIKMALNRLKFVGENSENPKPFVRFSCNLIDRIDRLITDILPEEYCQELIKKYLFVFEYDENIFYTGKKLTLNSYLLAPGNHYESRYKFFKNFFQDTVQKYWDVPHPKCLYQHPVNFMVNKFFNSVISETTNKDYDVRIFETFLEIFESVLQPKQDATSYLGLVYSIYFHKSDNSQVFGKMIVQKMPELIRTFSSESIIFISKELFNFLLQHRIDLQITYKEEILNVIEIFVNSGIIHCALIAADMLCRYGLKKDNEQYRAVVNTLRTFDHPGISALINKHLVSSYNSSIALYDY